ncbi:MAG TPA: hypothetical protein VE261_07790 [Gaiellaceae bacterium]|nr:hypothetical protein [Gaiellaceae bacterium]
MAVAIREWALPRLEELPTAGEGYEREAVRVAFDAFYRHAAQLDASLAALQAVEAFQRDAEALRNDLRAWRTLGLSFGQPDGSPLPVYDDRGPRISGAVVRLAGEAGLIVAVATLAALAHMRGFVIVSTMAVVLAVVMSAEWLAARRRFVPRGFAFVQHVPPDQLIVDPEPESELESDSWERGTSF